jgi:hypothetical protein
VPAGKRSAQYREERTIGGLELGPLDLAAQDLKLAAQDGELDVLGMLALDASEEHADKPACREVKEGQGHRPIAPDPDSHCSTHAAEVSEPHWRFPCAWRAGATPLREVLIDEVTCGDRPIGGSGASTRMGNALARGRAVAGRRGGVL